MAEQLKSSRLETEHQLITYADDNVRQWSLASALQSSTTAVGAVQ